MKSDLIDKYRNHLKHIKKYSVNTVVAYCKDIEQFSIYCNATYNEKDLLKSTHHMLRSWMVQLSKESVSARSINRKISSLNGFFKYLIQLKHINTNPVQKVVTPKIAKKLPEFVSEKEISRLTIDRLYNPNDYNDVRVMLILVLLYCTGIRRNELIEIKKSDVNYDRKELRVIGKGKKERVIPLSDSVLNVINTYLLLLEKDELPMSEYLFFNQKGAKVNPRTIYQLVKDGMGDVSSVSKKSPHILRHTFATHLLNNGADINAIKELLGHANLSATQVYTHNSISRLQEVYKKAHPKS